MKTENHDCAPAQVRGGRGARIKRKALTKAAFFGNTGPAGETLEQVYGSQRFERLRQCTDLYPTIVTSQNMDACLPELQDLEVIFGTWGLMPLTDAQLDCLPSLRALFYAAGFAGYFARPLLRRGIIVTSSAAANAIPVAEFTLAQILLANKGYFRNVREYRETANYTGSFVGPGNYGMTVSLLGAGQIGRKVIELLRPFNLCVIVFDPYLSESEAAALGVTKVSIREAFSHGNVVSNHVADVPDTFGLIDGPLFASMAANATFINTGRGRTVKHEDLISVFRARPDLTALLDVTDPLEPLPPDTALWKVPNIHISSHIAGSRGWEVGRVADLAIEEFERWRRAEPLRYSITVDKLERTV
jgi:phosphoglycerate dehydrogenase-like enzyme